MDLSAWEQGIRQASTTQFWFGVLLLAAFTVVSAFVFARNLRRARMMEDTPTSRIRSAAQGYVELDGVGELMNGPAIVSPLSGERCTWFSYKVERREEVRDGDKRRTRWRTLRSGTSDSLFRLVDETDECVIDPDGASVLPSVSRVWYGNAPDPIAVPPARKSWLPTLITKQYRYTEQLMRPGDRLYALGYFKTLDTGTHLRDLKDDVLALLREWKRDADRHLRAYDQNGDGRLDQREWGAVQRAAVQTVRSERLRDDTGRAVHVLARSPDAANPYILSAIPERALVRRYRRLATLAVALLLLGGLSTGWLLNVRLYEKPSHQEASASVVEYRSV
jgi:hypothetical protein